MFLLDTPVLLELRKAKAGGTDPALAAWAAAVPREQLFVSALSLVELEGLIARTLRTDKPAAQALRSWIDGRLVPAFDGHVLPVDAAIARRRGELPLTRTREALLAATALVHGLTLVTLDRTAYKGLRLKLLDPRSYEAETSDDNDWRTANRNGPLWLRNLFLRS
jgi:toxin FitB